MTNQKMETKHFSQLLFLSFNTRASRYISSEAITDGHNDSIDVMNLWDVTVLGLDSHPDYNKGPDHVSCFGP